jgi:hypothetical protein
VCGYTARSANNYRTLELLAPRMQHASYAPKLPYLAIALPPLKTRPPRQEYATPPPPPQPSSESLLSPRAGPIRPPSSAWNLQTQTERPMPPLVSGPRVHTVQSPQPLAPPKPRPVRACASRSLLTHRHTRCPSRAVIRQGVAFITRHKHTHTCMRSSSVMDPAGDMGAMPPPALSLLTQARHKPDACAHMHVRAPLQPPLAALTTAPWHVAQWSRLWHRALPSAPTALLTPARHSCHAPRFLRPAPRPRRQPRQHVPHQQRLAPRTCRRPRRHVSRQQRPAPRHGRQPQ